MKISRIFVGVIYFYLLVITSPLWLYALIKRDYVKAFFKSEQGESNLFIKYFFTVFIFSVILVLIVSLITAINAIILYNKGDYISLKKSMTAVKLWTIPFYIVNFIFSALICLAVTMGLRGMGLIFVPIPIAFTCTIIFLTGFYGIFYVKHLRKNFSLQKPPGIKHYFFQLIPVLDIIDTIYLLIKFKEEIRC